MQPLVSIGLPVYNGGEYLREALDSLLSQDYQNFELIISDNASTDATAEICREYAVRDARIEYHRAAENQGASWNFNRVLELSAGEFFMWAAHDDLWHPSFISKCVEALTKDTDAVLCHSQGQNITADKKPVGEPYIDYVNHEATMRGRWRRTHQNWQLHAAIYGLMRTETAKKVLPLEAYASVDLIFISQIILYGKIIQIPETLQYNRLPPAEVARYQSPEAMMEYLGAKSASKIRMHRLQVMFRCIGGLKYADLPPADFLKLSCDIFYVYLKSQFLHDFKGLVKSQINGLRSNKNKIIRREF